MNLGVNFQWFSRKKEIQHVILAAVEVVILALLWWKFFWSSGFALIWLAGTLFLALTLVYANNFLVKWFNAPKKKKPKDTLAERKAKHGASGGHTSRRF